MIKIDGIVKRNLQEQVAYNAEQIESLGSRVSILELAEDQTVVAVTITEASGTFTEEELAILLKNNAIIIHNGDIFVKGTGGENQLFYVMPSINIDETGVSQNYIEIDPSTREYVSGSTDYYPQASGGTTLYLHRLDITATGISITGSARVWLVSNRSSACTTLEDLYDMMRYGDGKVCLFSSGYYGTGSIMGYFCPTVSYSAYNIFDSSLSQVTGLSNFALGGDTVTEI